jgi:hypothetical protein
VSGPVAKFYRYPHSGGARKVKSRAWREWRRTHNDDEATWPGVDIVDVPDQTTAQKLARTRLTDQKGPDKLPLRDPLRPRNRTHYGGVTPVATISSSILSTHQEKESRGPKYACLDLAQSLPLCQDAAFKLWMVLTAHART